MGVRRAVELASAEAQRSSSVYTLGQLIHNPKVLSDLEVIGVRSAASVSQIPLNEECSVVIRAHGISPAVENKLRGTNCRIIDATCPKVKASQLKAKELSSAGFYLFLAGEAEHAEIEGIMGYASQFCVAGNADEAQSAAAALCKTNPNIKTALLGQTTISEEEYNIISCEIKKYFPDTQVVQTICSATHERQQSLRELLKEVCAVLVIGGKDSANTRRLFLIAQESGKPCALIEDPLEIPASFTITKQSVFALELQRLTIL